MTTKADYTKGDYQYEIKTGRTENPFWRIEYDHLENKGCNIEGPSHGIREALAIPFKIKGDDGILYFSGKMNVDALDAFGMYDPLTCYGRPDSGATELWIEENGEWTQV